VEKENNRLLKIPYSEGKTEIEGKVYHYKSNSHKGMLMQYLSDASGISKRIEKIRKPSHGALKALAKEYHNTVCEDEKCIIYEREMPSIQILPEVSIGRFEFVRDDSSIAFSQSQFSLILHAWLPKSNDRLHIRTGLLYYQKNASFDVPVQLEYIYPKRTFRPSIAYVSRASKHFKLKRPFKIK